MRGTPDLVGDNVGDCGITPAYAGNTVSIHAFCQSIKDHPRVCGEHLLIFSFIFSNLGSPPRMRGTLRSFLALFRSDRITPAYAGNTNKSDYIMAWEQDHPRVCGEHRIMAKANKNHRGSPPRMRGTHGGTIAMAALLRITPAYAGNTPSHPLGYSPL